MCRGAWGADGDRVGYKGMEGHREGCRGHRG